jgi:hypothetical protein
MSIELSSWMPWLSFLGIVLLALGITRVAVAIAQLYLLSRYVHYARLIQAKDMKNIALTVQEQAHRQMMDGFIARLAEQKAQMEKKK